MEGAILARTHKRGLLDLPNEVLYDIFERCTKRNWWVVAHWALSLGLLCRRFDDLIMGDWFIRSVYLDKSLSFFNRLFAGWEESKRLTTTNLLTRQVRSNHRTNCRLVTDIVERARGCVQLLGQTHPDISLEQYSSVLTSTVMASLGVREVLRLLVHFRTWPYVIISRPGSPDYQAVLADLVALIAAARIGNLSALKFLIDKGVEVTWYDEVFSGPLHMAASGGHVSAMELLVHKGANINGQDPPRGRTPLHYAAEAGHVQATNFLIRMGAELNFLDVTRHSPINIAAALGHTNVVAELLTQKSVSPNKDILSEDSPLFLAIEGGHIDVVKVLLDRHDIDLDVERHLIGETPLVVAANYNRDSIVRLLLSRDDIRIEPRKGRMTPFCTAAQRGHLTIVQTLIEMQPDLDKNHRVEKGGLTPLIFAAHDGALDVLRLLLNCDDVDVNLHTTELPDSHGYTALEYAVKRGQIEAVKILLEHPRTQFYNPKGLGPTLLHSAVRSGKPRVVQLLLDHGAYVNSQDQRGQTPLHEGVSHRPQYSEEILKILLNYPKTMVNQRDHNGRTALTLAIRWGGDDRIKFLIDHPEIRICDLDNNGDSAFMHAVKKGHVGAVQRLLAKYPEGNDDHIKEGLKVASDAEIVQLLESRLDPGFMVD